MAEQALLQRSTTLAPVPASAREARKLVRDALAQVGERSTADAVELAVSELVTNAVLHAAMPLTLSIEVTADAVTVSVRDDHPQLPVRREPSAGATTGRGLAIVEALADEHGIDPQEPVGKAVWFRLRRAR